MRRPPLLLTLIILLAATVMPATAQSARSRFLSTFGQRIQAVGRTPATDDNQQLAADMLEAAKTQTADPEMLALIVDAGQQVADDDPASYPIGVAMLRLLAEHVPLKRIDALTAAAELQQRHLSVDPAAKMQIGGEMVDVSVALGDALADQELFDVAVAYYAQAAQIAQELGLPKEAQLNAAMHRLDVRRQIKTLSARLSKDPTDRAAADELMKLYLIELNDPQAAVKFQFTATDPLLKAQVSAATREVATLNAAQAVTLADWYAELMKQASPAAVPVMQQRAAEYYRRYLALHKYDDADRQRAQAALDGLEQAAQQLASAGPQVEQAPQPDAVATIASANPAVMKPEPAPLPEPAQIEAPPAVTPEPAPAAPAVPAPLPAGEEGWINLYSNIDVPKDTGRGIWAYANGAVSGEPPTPAQFTLPTAPAGDYILEVQFKRTTSIGSVALHLPVGDSRVLAVFGERRRRERDHIAGLSTVGGEPAENNPTTTKLELTTDQVYTARVEVATEGFDTKIAVMLDGKPLFEWKGSPKTLGVSNAWARFDPKAFGLGIDGAGSVTFLAARLKGVGNEPKPLR